MDGAVSPYTILENGSLENISRSAETNQLATFWLVSDGRKSAFTTNTPSGTLSRYRVRRNGRVRLRGAPIRFPGASDSFPTDVATTADGRFLYTLNTGRGTIGMFQVRPKGNLVFLGEAGALQPHSGMEGIAAR